MEAMLGETGEGSREEAGNSCDAGATCYNGEVNGDLEDAMDMCNVIKLNSSMLKTVSNKCVNEEGSSIMDSPSEVASSYGGGGGGDGGGGGGDGDSDGGGGGESAEQPQETIYQISDKVPNSEPANMCRDLESEVPTVVGSIEHIDIGKTAGVTEMTPASSHNIKNCDISKEILDLNKNCDDSLSGDCSVNEENPVVNVCVTDKNNLNIPDYHESKSGNRENCVAAMTEKSIHYGINSGCSGNDYSDNSEEKSRIEKSDSAVGEIKCCVKNEESEKLLETEANGKIDDQDQVMDGSHEIKMEKVDELDAAEVKKNEMHESKSDSEKHTVDGFLQNNDNKSIDECHVSSSVEKDEKSVEQVQTQSENTEIRSEETSSKAKKSRKSAVVLNLTPRRSSRNLNKQKSYVEKEEEPEIQEIAPIDPLADPLSTDPLRDDKENSKTRNARKNTIVVNDTKRLVEIATGSKGVKGGKKEPTLVIIDTNSILSGRGPVPVSHGSPPGPSSVTSSSSGYSVLPIALPAQGLYSPIRLNTPLPPNPLHSPAPPPVQPRPSPPQILPTLTDDMYVVEAPSFIVPYVYEKPPIKPLKEYLEQLEIEIEEENKSYKAAAEIVEEKVAQDSSQESECGEIDLLKSQNDVDDSTAADDCGGRGSGEGDGEGSGDGDGGDNCDGTDGDDGGGDQCKVNGEESEVTASSLKDEDVNQNNDKDTDASENDIDSDNISKSKASEVEGKEENCTKDLPAQSVKDNDAENDAEKNVEDEKCTENEKPAENQISENIGNNSIEAKEKNELKLDDSGKSSYFDNPLGKFFMQIGINLVQEYVQTDLLRSQKRKREREGRKGTVSTQFAINSLVKNLEFSKENNEPFHLEQKKCEYCSFKTESSLVMAQHLETPHMRNYVYRCNFCPLEVRSPHDILFHMEAEHNVRGRLERAPAFHQCPNCPFEDSQKGKLTRHMLSCAKKHKPERNQEPPPDWEPPAKIPRLARSRPTALGLGAAAYQAMAAKSVHPLLPKLVPGSVLPPTPGLNRGRGRPPIHGRYVPQDMKAAQRPIAPTQVRQNMMYRPGGSPGQVLLPTAYQIAGSQIYQVVGSQSQMPMVPSSVSPVPRLAMSPSTAVTTKPTCDAMVSNMATGNNSITIQSASKSPTAKLLQQPSISITPLPRQPAGMAPGSTMHPKHIGHSVHPGHSANKATFVICEICDGYIKDLEQLRNHMQWIHKVKIHPKMIYNRPPLNCQKCQFRFFTDQGLERHLLGSHGLVTSSMQEAANKGKDGGRCPVCGRVYQWKLLNHVARDHNMSLKPAHLSYKCTVCTATFGMYKQFENHVYSAHSVVAKRVIDKKSPQVPRPQSSETLLKPLKINDEITIIPQPARPRPGPASRTGAVSGIMQQNMGPKRFKQRLQQKQSSVQVIELEDSPVKKENATDGSTFQENGEDTLNAVKERLRRRKSLEISQVDSECSSQLSDDSPAKKRRRNDE